MIVDLDDELVESIVMEYLIGLVKSDCGSTYPEDVENWLRIKKHARALLRRNWNFDWDG